MNEDNFDEIFHNLNLLAAEEDKELLDVDFNRGLITDIRQTINLPTIGRYATTLLNNDKGSLPEREIIDDVKDILGFDNYELLREFVEIAMVRGIIGYRYQIWKSKNASKLIHRQRVAKKKQLRGISSKEEITNHVVLKLNIKKQHDELMKLTGIFSKVDNE
jgi:hypothetical protein